MWSSRGEQHDFEVVEKYMRDYFGLVLILVGTTNSNEVIGKLKSETRREMSPGTIRH